MLNAKGDSLMQVGTIGWGRDSSKLGNKLSENRLPNCPIEEGGIFPVVQNVASGPELSFIRLNRRRSAARQTGLSLQAQIIWTMKVGVAGSSSRR